MRASRGPNEWVLAQLRPDIEALTAEAISVAGGVENQVRNSDRWVYRAVRSPVARLAAALIVRTHACGEIEDKQETSVDYWMRSCG